MGGLGSPLLTNKNSSSSSSSSSIAAQRGRVLPKALPDLPDREPALVQRFRAGLPDRGDLPTSPLRFGALSLLFPPFVRTNAIFNFSR